MLFIFLTPMLIRHLWQLKTVVFLHWSQLCIVPLRNYMLTPKIIVYKGTAKSAKILFFKSEFIKREVLSQKCPPFATLIGGLI